MPASSSSVNPTLLAHVDNKGEGHYNSQLDRNNMPRKQFAEESTFSLHHFPRKAECCPVCDLRKACSPRRNKDLKGDRAKRQIISSEGFIGSY
ncbi:hypothetical protein TNCV_3641701 [Trichonephila clavipes]|nr:hypothetical protein TNCV_3641701 [Trichonephila clavipes]